MSFFIFITNIIHADLKNNEKIKLEKKLKYNSPLEKKLNYES